jgi:hypothetical protein
VDDNNETWYPLGFSLATVVTRKEYEQYSSKGVFKAPKDMEFYEKHTPSDTDTHGSSLNRALAQHWNATINRLVDDYAAGPPMTYTDPWSQRRFVIDDEAYGLALDAYLNGMKYPDGKLQENKVELQGQAHYADAVVLANPVELAEQLEIDELVRQNLPYVIETAHGHPGSTDKAPWAVADVWVNPGRWREVDWDTEDDVTLDGIPFIRIETEPERFQGPVEGDGRMRT